jgi:hypothetical protein
MGSHIVYNKMLKWYMQCAILTMFHFGLMMAVLQLKHVA